MNQTKHKRIGVVLAFIACGACINAKTTAVSLRTFTAPEADQGVAVDEKHFYAIDNYEIGKYDKTSGERVGHWKEVEGGPIIHLNSGVVIDGKLYCAHSNYPGIPMASSIEVWDTETMEHAESHSFGIFAGSATWVDYLDGYWYVAFVHYGKFSIELDTDPRWSTLVKFDKEWRRLEAWTYPREVTRRFEPYSNSGGAFGPDGLIYATGHDLPEVYILGFPEAGTSLEYLETFTVDSEGQGIAWDKSEPWVLYVMRRHDLEIIPTKVMRGEQAALSDGE